MSTLKEFIESHAGSYEAKVLAEMLTKRAQSNIAKRNARREARFSDDVVEFLKALDRRKDAESRLPIGGDFI